MTVHTIGLEQQGWTRTQRVRVRISRPFLRADRFFAWLYEWIYNQVNQRTGNSLRAYRISKPFFELCILNIKLMNAIEGDNPARARLRVLMDGVWERTIGRDVQR